MGGYRRNRNRIDAFLIIVLAVLDAVLAGSNLGTLRTFQTYACDGQHLVIRCPRTTIVSVQFAQYVRQASAHKRCSSTSSLSTSTSTSTSASQGQGSTTTSSANSLSSSSSVALADADGTDCLATNSTLQYQLFTVVVETCTEQKQCKLSTAAHEFGKDPCPETEKHVEVVFKCRPNEFVTKVICEGEQLQLKCQKGTRIAIYSANFGRRQRGCLDCPQPEGMEEEECQASYATEMVMRICHGRRKCNMLADIQTFGNPCSEGVKPYLRVVYTCVPTKVLKSMYLINGDGEDEEEANDGDLDLVEESSYPPPPTDDTTIIDGEEVSHEQVKPTKPSKKKPQPAKSFSSSSSSSSTFSPEIHNPDNSDNVSLPSPTFSLPPLSTGRDVQGDDSDEKKEDGDQTNCTESVPPERDLTIGFITEWIGAYNYLKDNTEKLALYLMVSISAGLVLFLVVVVGRLCVQKRRERARAQLNISEPLPNGFGDDMSDLDQDITDLSHGSSRMPEPNVEMVRYTSRSTMRRQDSDTNPRAPMARTHNNFYYS
jgi:hypothetical protein